LNWPCVPGRRPRPDDIDAPHSARDEGLRQTEFDSQGPFFSVRNDLWFHCSQLLVAPGRAELGVEGSNREFDHFADALVIHASPEAETSLRVEATRSRFTAPTANRRGQTRSATHRLGYRSGPQAYDPPRHFAQNECTTSGVLPGGRGRQLAAAVGQARRLGFCVAAAFGWSYGLELLECAFGATGDPSHPRDVNGARTYAGAHLFSTRARANSRNGMRWAPEPIFRAPGPALTAAFEIKRS
jgi:hypothetical protein